MKNKWRILKILVTVILFGFLLSFSLQRFSDAPMEQVSVNLVDLQESEKVYFIDEKEIRNLNKKSYTSNKIADIDIPALLKKISMLPTIDSDNVYLNLNRRLNVDIVQRVPDFRLDKNRD